MHLFVSVRKRLAKERTMGSYELSELQQDANELWWDLTVPGPTGSPYEGKHYQVRIYYESTYPFRSPRLQFQTPIFHPNLTTNGLSSNILNEPWNPTCNIETLYQRIQYLLVHPNPSFAYNAEAAELLQKNPAAFAAAASSY